MDEKIPTADIRTKEEKSYSTSEVGEWLVDYIKKQYCP